MKVGIIGAGQLGRMLALAGYPLGQRFVFVDKSEEAPGGQVGAAGQGTDELRSLDHVTVRVAHPASVTERRGLRPLAVDPSSVSQSSL